MKRTAVLIWILAMASGLMAHKAFNGWEQYELRGKVRYMAMNPMLGDAQRILEFDPEGKIIREMIFSHAWGWDSSTPLERFMTHDLEPALKQWIREGLDPQVINYSYYTDEGRIVQCLGEDLDGGIAVLTDYIYEGADLVRSITRGEWYEATTEWTNDKELTRTVFFDSLGNVQTEYVSGDDNDADGEFFCQYDVSYEYDFAGNIITEIIHEPSTNDIYEAETRNYVYFNPIRSITASSDLKAYPASNIMDQDPQTTWVAKSRPDGIGDWVLITLDSEQFVESLDIAPGFASVKKGQDLFLLNNRLKRVTLTLSDGQQIMADFNGKDRKVNIPINSATSSIKISIDAIYPGSKWRDTCISELELHTR